MKVGQKEYNYIKIRMFKVLDANPGIRSGYKAKGLSEQRFRWDIFWAAKIKIGDGVGTFGDITLPDVNDAHLDTVFRKIITEYHTANPPKKYHQEKHKRFKTGLKASKGKSEKAYWQGKVQSEKESLDWHKKRGKNNPVNVKYYIGLQKVGKILRVFGSASAPTKEALGSKYEKVWGPYPTDLAARIGAVSINWNKSDIKMNRPRKKK